MYEGGTMNESGLTDSQEWELEFVPANGWMFTIPGKRLCGAKMI
jgi:hypothetical protein